VVVLVVKRFGDYVREGDPIWVQRSSHGRHNLIAEHGHDCFELVFVVYGEGRHKINRDYYDVRAGDVFVILPQENHLYFDMEKTGLEIINCLFLAETVRKTLPDATNALLSLPYVSSFYGERPDLPRKQSLDARQSGLVLAILERMIEELKDRSPGYETIVRHLLVDLLIVLSRFALHNDTAVRPRDLSARGHEILVRKVRHFLETHYQQKMTAESLARHFNISRRHLYRVFRQETGESIKAALHKIRIERAKQMLMETDRSVESIASAVGFGDPSFFTRLFCRLVGRTPGDFRKAARSQGEYSETKRTKGRIVPCTEKLPIAAPTDSSPSSPSTTT